MNIKSSVLVMGATKQTVKKDVGMKEGNTFEGGSEMLRRGWGVVTVKLGLVIAKEEWRQSEGRAKAGRRKMGEEWVKKGRKVFNGTKSCLLECCCCFNKLLGYLL